MGEFGVRGREYWLVAAIIVAGFAINLALRESEFVGADSASYLAFARDGLNWHYWLEPQAVHQTYFPVGYPMVLTLLLLPNPESTLIPQLFFMICASLISFLTWFLARPLGKATRITTIVVVTLSPTLAWMTRHNGYEMLDAMLITVSLALLWPGVRVVGKQHWWVALIAGAFMGLGFLAQPSVLAIAAVLAFIAFRRGFIAGVAYAVSFAVLPLAWAIRNGFVLHSFKPFASNGPLAFWHGNNWTTQTGGVQESLILPPPQYPVNSDGLLRAGIDFIVTQPEAAFSLFLKRMMRLLEPTHIYLGDGPGKLNWGLHVYAITFSSVGVLLFCAWAFGRLWIKPPEIPAVGVPAAVVLAFFVSYFPFQSEQRYLTPILPLALMVSVATALALGQRILRRGGDASFTPVRQSSLRC
jgi:hypothetical protein